MNARADKWLVQVQPKKVGLHRKAPYLGWAAFQDRLSQLLNGLHKVAEIRAVTRIGVRYLNRFEFATDSVELRDYFNFYPYVADELPQTLQSAKSEIVAIVEPDRRLRLQIYPPKDKVTRLTMVLDLDMIRMGEMAPADVLREALASHDVLETVFYRCLTPLMLERLRERKGQPC